MTYLLKVNVILMLLYGFYRLMVGRDTFFGWRRWMLWSIYMVALLLPMIHIESWVTSHQATVSMASAYAETVMPAMVVYPAPAEVTLADVIRWIWLLGMALLSLRFVWQVASIWRLALSTRVQRIGGQDVHVLAKGSSPFSFFGWIFFDPSSLTDEQLPEVLSHEGTHVRQLHSADVLLSEVVAVICWFNPFVWLLKTEVRINLEYLADEHVLAEGNARKSYQYHLLGLACSNMKGGQLANNFNVLPLKKRIAMMNKRRTREIGKGKYLLLIPLAAVLAVVSNIETVARTLRTEVPVISRVAERASAALQTPVVASAQDIMKPMEAMKETVVAVDTAVRKNVAAPVPVKEEDQADVVYNVVEKMPQFPGGTAKMMEFFKSNLSYPDEARQKGIAGRVIVQFVVNQNGTISDAKVVRSVEETLDAEALRAINAMPAWEPGLKNGKAVRVKYNVPVAFGMNKSKVETKISTAQAGNILIIVDGKEVKDINEVKPEDIKSMNILKGEAATKIYGEKGKNGVILITVK
ncbi:MAG: TonB family protein [Prevotella sp.]|nr:TonB family protein [Prevotella sp.]